MTASGTRHQASNRTASARSHDRVSNRLRRAAGQLAGLLTMYEQGRRSAELLDQLAAARAALDAVALLIIEEQAATCIERAIADTDSASAVADLTATLRRYRHGR